MKVSKFHQDVQKDLVQFKKYYSLSIDARKKANSIRKIHNLKIQSSRFNLDLLYHDAINDSNIDYSVKDFFKDMNKLQLRTNNLKNYAMDLIILKDFVNNNQIQRGTFIYTILHFYASHFDCLINFLKPIAKKIKSGKRYVISNNNQQVIEQIRTAEHVELLFKKHNLFFYNYLLKFLNRDLRNSVAHENYTFNNKKIFYKKKRINVDSVFNKICLMGDFINKLQALFNKYGIVISQSILDQNIKKKDLGSFLRSFVV